MGKDVFLSAAAHWITLLRRTRGDLRVRDLRADRIDREELTRALQLGPDLVVYLGHGRPRGWSGYQGVRWRHIETLAPRRPIGIVIALACDTLAFGARWVETGRAAAYVGAEGSLDVGEGIALSERLARRIAAGDDRDVAGLLEAADAGSLPLRVIGDPRTALVSARHSTPAGAGESAASDSGRIATSRG